MPLKPMLKTFNEIIKLCGNRQVYCTSTTMDLCVNLVKDDAIRETVFGLMLELEQVCKNGQSPNFPAAGSSMALASFWPASKEMQNCRFLTR
jgi:hypothetical protein